MSAGTVKRAPIVECPACERIVRWVDGRFTCPCGATGDANEYDRLLSHVERAS